MNSENMLKDRTDNTGHIMIHLDGNECGGIRSVSEMWYKGLVERGIRVSYLMNRNGTYTEELNASHRETYCADMGAIKSSSWYLGRYRMPDLLGWLRSSWSMTNARKKVQTILKEARPDTILGNGVKSAAMIGGILKANDVRLISCFHGISNPNDFMNFRKRIIAFLLNAYSHEIVGVSHAAIDPIKPYLNIPHRVIYNTVPEIKKSCEARNRLRKEWNIPKEAVAFGNASRITPAKAIHRFVDAARMLIALKPDLPLAFLIAGEPRTEGDREYLRDILEKIKKGNLQGKIRYVGYQSIAEFYSALDVFCHTHEGVEPLGLTIVEALSACLPVILCDRGGFLEFLPGDVGFKYDGASRSELMESMKKMLDASLRDEQSRKGSAFFLNQYISYENWVDAWLSTLIGQRPYSE